MKTTVEHLRGEYAFSERRACGLIGLVVCIYRYQPRKDDVGLRLQLRKKSRAMALGVSGCCCGEPEPIVSHKSVWRVYHEASLSVKRRQRKRLLRVGRPRITASAPNQKWALDFISDRLVTGRSARVLSVIDAFTRECTRARSRNQFR